MPTKLVLIIDYGSQFTQLIARRVRLLGVFCKIVSPTSSLLPADAFILSGGPESATKKNAPCIPQKILDSGKPILGICYGMQIMMLQLGGKVKNSQKCEYGSTKINCTHSNSVLWKKVIKENQTVWMSHGDEITQLADGFKILAKSSHAIAAVEDTNRNYYGLQFHPEVSHTINGVQILENFLQKICGLSRDWTMSNYLDNALVKIRLNVGKENVLLALSGGVDSSVTADLLHKAIGKQLTCVFVDNGLLRHKEADLIFSIFKKKFGEKFIIIDAAKIFCKALSGVTNPEEKRKIIGKTFIEVFEKQAKKLKNIKWLAQGTIYPDIVESAKTGSGKSVIKTHHNVGGLPDKLQLKLLEPLRELFKDEVRKLGKELGLENKLLNRHPFPGPGLAVRILGEVTPARLEIVRKADKIFLEEILNTGVYNEIAQAFAVLLPIHSVGVMGDKRTYENTIALRAVSTDDFMTADWVRLDNQLLSRVSQRIINEVDGINRVVYDISSKPPATIEWE